MFQTAASRSPAVRVDFRENEWDYRVEKLMQQGFNGPCIAREAGLTPGQVYYRTAKLGGMLAFRRGESEKAKELIHRVDAMIARCKSLRRDLHKIREERVKRRNHGQQVREERKREVRVSRMRQGVS